MGSIVETVLAPIVNEYFLAISYSTVGYQYNMWPSYTSHSKSGIGTPVGLVVCQASHPPQFSGVDDIITQLDCVRGCMNPIAGIDLLSGQQLPIIANNPLISPKYWCIISSAWVNGKLYKT